jgi:uncharacterized protein YbaR (Trm112 family)
MEWKQPTVIVCPACHGRLAFEAAAGRLQCAGCQRVYRMQDGIPVLIVDRAV